MTNIVMDTGTIAELNDIGPDDEILEHGGDIGSDRSAYGIPRPDAHAFRDMEELIVNAAAHSTRRSVRRDGNASQADRGENRRTRHEARRCRPVCFRPRSSISR